MKRLPFHLVLLAVACALPAAVLAQEEPKPADQKGSDSQETAISEDNYRRYMELRDERIQRDAFPVDAYKPQGQEKLQSLPESSQRWLRDQLREIIVDGDAWQPGDENKEHPYVPSPAAKTDGSLRSQEQAAWAELLQNYNAREAAIYANSARSEAASAATQGTGAGMQAMDSAKQGAGAGKQGSQEQQQRPRGGVAGEQPEQRAEDATAEATESAAMPGETAARSPAGVTQSALEYLRQQGLDNAASGSGQAPGGAAGSPGQMAEQSQQASSAAQMAQSAQASGSASQQSSAAQQMAQSEQASQSSAQQASNAQQMAQASENSQQSQSPQQSAQAAQANQSSSQQSSAAQQVAQSDQTSQSPPAESSASSESESQNEGKEDKDDAKRAHDVKYVSPGYLAIEDLTKVRGVGGEPKKQEDEQPARPGGG